MRVTRIHVPGPLVAGGEIVLPAPAGEHLTRVLRLGVGDEVDVFDGRGRLWRAEIVQAGKKSAVVRLIAPAMPAAIPAPAASIPSPTTSRRTPARSAPSAIRTASSFVRCDTEYASTP